MNDHLEVVLRLFEDTLNDDKPVHYMLKSVQQACAQGRTKVLAAMIADEEFTPLHVLTDYYMVHLQRIDSCRTDVIKVLLAEDRLKSTTFFF